jgi:hypothetical protein
MQKAHARTGALALAVATPTSEHKKAHSQTGNNGCRQMPTDVFQDDYIITNTNNINTLAPFKTGAIDKQTKSGNNLHNNSQYHSQGIRKMKA